MASSPTHEPVPRNRGDSRNCSRITLVSARTTVASLPSVRQGEGAALTTDQMPNHGSAPIDVVACVGACLLENTVWDNRIEMAERAAGVSCDRSIFSGPISVRRGPLGPRPRAHRSCLRSGFAMTAGEGVRSGACP